MNFVTELSLGELREAIQVYHGCQHHQGNCQNCRIHDGGCKGWIEDKQFDEDIEKIFKNLGNWMYK